MSLSLGLQSYVSWVWEQPGASSFRLGGLQKCWSSTAGQLMGIAATCSFPSDVALLMLNRRVRWIDLLEDQVRSKVEYALNVSEAVWDVCARAVD